MLAVTVIANINEEIIVMKLILQFIVLISLNLVGCSSSNANNSEVKMLNNNWTIYPSEKITGSGKEISSTSFQVGEWYKTEIPKTVLAVLVDNNVYKNIYFDRNLEAIPTEQFTKPWWYRKSFTIDSKNELDNFNLTFEGINYKADIWLNGINIATKENIEGAFGIFNIMVSEHIKKGENVLAVEVFPPKVGDLTIGFVDWNPAAPDNNMGLWRGVQLKKTRAVELNNVFVKPNVNLKTLTEASLTISATLSNHSNKEISTKVIGKVGAIEFQKNVKLKGNEKIEITFLPAEYKQLNIDNPKLWWPNNLGEPNLYNLKLQAIVENEISDKQNVRFGIREVSDYINDEGHRGYKINGKPVVIKGAGWVDDLLLNDSDEKVISQMQYAKHMNLNTIRLEGFWGKNKTLYNAADEMGLLLMIGWSCHWEWEGYCGRKETQYMCIDTPRDIAIQAKAYRDQVVWLRNHPSIFVWVFGSDKLPSPELETKLNYYLNEVDSTRPILSTCKDKDFDGTLNRSEISGTPRVKMIGPYAYEPPIYWYVADKLGGAYGFNTETGPGPQVPPLESIKKMIPENKLWPMGDSWKYHLGRNEFESLDRYETAFNNRYGKVNSVEEFAAKSQVSNYEAIRPMFEAFSVNKPKATGVIQWMFNSAWPEMFWQLFDYYLMPNGAFYGTKKACQPLNLVYNYKDKDIYAVNDFYENKKELRAELKIFNKDSELIYEQSKKFDTEENSSKKIIDIPETLDIKNLHFVNLELFNKEDKKVSDNFYWLSAKEDVLDFPNSDWFFTPIKSYSDLTELNTLPKAEISYKMLNSTSNNFEIEVENETDKIAFFIDVKVLDKEKNESILPIFLSDNYFSLLPGESKTISGSFKKKDNLQSRIEVKGLNTNKLIYN